MKDSIGGAWLIGLAAVFIVLFASYLAVSINYTKAFKVKNRIINIIEENEGYTAYQNNYLSPGNNFDSMSTTDDQLDEISTTDAKIFRYLKEIGYSRDSITENTSSKCFDGDSDSYRAGGYCIQKVCGGHGAYYRVMTFINFEIPLINFKILIPISGETKTMFHIQDSFQCTKLK